MTKILPIRLNEKEFQMLDEILSSENCESENRSEWIRLLIHREWNKRKGLGVPTAESFQSAFRAGGRPSNSYLMQLRVAGKTRITGSAGVSSVIRLSDGHQKLVRRPPLQISPSTTRASGGVLQRTKTPRVTRRAGVKTLRAK